VNHETSTTLATCTAVLLGLALVVIGVLCSMIQGCGGGLPPLPPCPPLCLTPKPSASPTETPTQTVNPPAATATRVPTTPRSPSPSVRPSFTPTATPTATATATPTPGVVMPFPVNSGKAIIRVLHADTLPLGPTNDNLVLFVLTAETDGLDPNQPVLEMAMRGTNPAPCLERRPGNLCGDKAGLVPRWTANIAWDRTLDWSAGHEDESLAKSCGDGVNYHQRLALGPLGPDGELLVQIEWNHAQLSIKTPVDSVTISSRKVHTARFGRVIVGAPWDRQPASQWRSWLWRPFSAGALIEIVSWEAVPPIGLVTTCP